MPLIIHSLVFLSICFSIYWFVLPVKWRSAFLFGASLYFMSLFSFKYTLFYTVNAVMIYYAGTLITKDEKKRLPFLRLSLVWLIGVLCVFKYGHVLLNAIMELGFKVNVLSGTTFSKIALPLGLSYVVFRQIHYIVEIYRKNLPEHSFWDFASYLFFFPTFIAGPVDRFQSFHPQIEGVKTLEASNINIGLFRITSGLIKKYVIADFLITIIIPILKAPQDFSRIETLVSVYGLAIVAYMDFSGYTDMALGVSRLFGYKIMENFNKPFIQKNIALFWRNWHISVYSFIRDYVFLPVFGYRASTLKIYIGVFMTMFLFCLWHEGNLPFLLLGVYNGLTLVLWHLFQEIKRKHQRVRIIANSKYMDPFSIFLTFNVFSFSVIVFFVDLDATGNILKTIFL